MKQTAKPIWTLAMDGPRVAYASGGRIYVWNVVTGATSVVKGTYSNAKHSDNAAEVAIAGKRVAWIKRQQIGNTEQPQRLYTAPVGGSALRLRRVLGYTDMGCGAGGSQIAGLVGSGNVLAVSTWQSSSDGMVPAKQRLNLITHTGLRPIATWTNHDRVRISRPWAHRGRPAPDALLLVPAAERYCDLTPPTRVAIYSVDGTLFETDRDRWPGQAGRAQRQPADRAARVVHAHIRGLRLDNRRTSARLARHTTVGLRGSRAARRVLGQLPKTIRQPQEPSPAQPDHQPGRRDRDHHEQPLPRPSDRSSRPASTRSTQSRTPAPGNSSFVPTAKLLAALS